MDTYTITALEYLLTIANADDSLSEYFASLPPVTYQYARYTDWIRPYLQNQLAKAEAGYGTAIYAGRKEAIVKVLSLCDTFETYLKSRSGAVLDQASPLKDESGASIKRKLEFSDGNDGNEDTTDSTAKQPQEEKIDTAKASDLIPASPPAIVVLNSVDETYLG